MRNFLLLPCLLFMVLIVGGCDDRVSVAELESKITHQEEHIARLRTAIVELGDVANRLGSAEAGELLAKAESALKEAESELPTMRANLAALQKDADGKVPTWQAAIAAGWPVLLLALKAIPGAGPIAGGIAEALWRVYSTRKQKEEEASDAVTVALEKKKEA